MDGLEAFTPKQQQRVDQALQAWRQYLLDQQLPKSESPSGHWKGQLSDSALSTATAVSALSTVVLANPGTTQSRRLVACLKVGMRYLLTCQNQDGGFGDTDRSPSNIATTLLVLAAKRLADQVFPSTESNSFPIASKRGAFDTNPMTDTSWVERAEAYVRERDGWEGLRRRYGKDSTFVVPILTNCAIAGMIPWEDVPRLPFEMAVFPQSVYRFLQMPVVSYAIPALVAIGQTRHYHGPSARSPIRQIRAAAVKRTTNVLSRMQPPSGGYLEAIPLTSFVLMGLATTGRATSDVALNCTEFLAESMTEKGSWPIDVNLATFVTSLAIEGLSSASGKDQAWLSRELVEWLLDCQHLKQHPFTGASPGGWGWTDLPGAVPDGDDTAAAILALAACRTTISERAIDPSEKRFLLGRIDQAISRGQRWLLKLQNRNGGWPTFCRGWGKLPFDRSSVDITAHALRALQIAPKANGGNDLPNRRTRGAINRGWQFIRRAQRPDGSWVPLWFGNHDQVNDENPWYGTGRVLRACAESGYADSEMAFKGTAFLIQSQNPDNGWGGGPSLRCWFQKNRGSESPPQSGGIEGRVSSVEETAIALDGLAAIWSVLASHGPIQGPQKSRRTPNQMTDHRNAILGGSLHLADAIEEGRHPFAWPIGFYFAKLWYYEQIYPAIFATSALSRVLMAMQSSDTNGVAVLS